MAPLSERAVLEYCSICIRGGPGRRLPASPRVKKLTRFPVPWVHRFHWTEPGQRGHSPFRRGLWESLKIFMLKVLEYALYALLVTGSVLLVARLLWETYREQQARRKFRERQERYFRPEGHE